MFTTENIQQVESAKTIKQSEKESSSNSESLTSGPTQDTEKQSKSKYCVIISADDPADENIYVHYLTDGRVSVLRKYSMRYEIVNERINEYLKRDKNTPIDKWEFEYVFQKLEKSNESFTKFLSEDSEVLKPLE